MLNKKPLTRPLAQGFTLLEVLIALAILAISLTALIKSQGQNIRDTLYLKDKVLADNVAIEALHLVQIQAITPRGGDISEETLMGGKKWFWKAYMQKDKACQCIKVKVEVYKHKKPYVTHFGYMPLSSDHDVS